MLGTLVDAYYRGYDCITVEDCVATTSPAGGLENMLYNAGGVSVVCCLLRRYGVNNDHCRVMVSSQTRKESSKLVHEAPNVFQVVAFDIWEYREP